MLRENKIIAERLREAAALMELKHANPYRVAAYRRAADSVEALTRDLGEIVRAEGIEGLMTLPGVGSQIADSIFELVRTGHWMQLERLRGVQAPEALFSKVPGVGEELAQRIVSVLHIDSLEALEIAACDGSLRKVPGFGPRRIAIVRAALAEMLARRPFHRTSGIASTPEPSVDVLLDIDREYREKSAAHELRVIAPRRFNPQHEAWLPILETERAGWRFTALYSNTALAHSLGRTRDWVVIHYQSDFDTEGQSTVVTETRGELTGERVVRGHEGNCVEYYERLKPNGATAA